MIALLARVRRHLGAPALAGVNLVATAALLLAPTALHASNGSLLALSIFLVSLQAGQAASVQTNATEQDRGSLLEVAEVVVLAGAIALAVTLGFGWPTLIVLAVAGLLAGFVTGPRANALLRGERGALRYQQFVLTRNACWLGFVLLAVWLLPDGPFWGTVAAWVVFTVELWRRSVRSVGLRLPVRLVTLAGALAALAYRNDVNIVRSAADRQGVFASWHVLLTGYSIAQAVTGFLVLQYLYAGTQGRSDRAQVGGRLRYVPGLMGLAAAGIAIGLLSLDVGLVGQGIALVVAGCAVSVQSALAHLQSVSYSVYGAGLAGVAGCWLLGRLGLPPTVLLAVDLAVIGTVVLVTLIIFRRTGSTTPSSANRKSLQPT